MTISRGQMNRQLYMGGGIMNAMPREQFGIGSSLKKLGKKAVGAVKDIASSDLGKAALLAAGTYYAGGGNLFGAQRAGMSGFKFANLPGAGFFAKPGVSPLTRSAQEVGLPGTRFGKFLSGAKDAITGSGNLGKFAALGAVSTFLTSTLGMSEEQAEEEVARDPSKYLSLYYKNLNPQASEEEVQEFVTTNTSEYAEGGRIGYALGGNELPPDPTTPVNPFKPKPIGPVLPNKEMASNEISIDKIEMLIKRGADNDLIKEFTGASDGVINQIRDAMERKNKAGGGIMNRMNYALGDTASQNAMQAAGIEGLPVRQNPKGVKELDLRDSGGFIPPVGIKEKEDDIPAMLSNNEFVFTADAVRGMGNGDVELGAQRMYDQMKMLEAGGKV